MFKDESLNNKNLVSIDGLTMPLEDAKAAGLIKEEEKTNEKDERAVKVQEV